MRCSITGEQDGRYLAFAGQQLRGRGGGAAARGDELRAGREQFRRHFERLEGDLGFRMMSLNSLWFPHHFASTGYYTLIGAETAQGLPNAQLFYAFLRGAAKQHGTLVWGDASVYNRFGFKQCPVSADGTHCECTTDGTSVSLLRRLMNQQALYGSAILSFESGLTCGVDIRSPIGLVQDAVKDWTSDLGPDPGTGTHLATTAVLLDFYSGYTPPRQLYSANVFRVWGNIPWEQVCGGLYSLQALKEEIKFMPF